MINHKFSFENAFKEILYRIDNWINEIPAKLKKFKKGLINIRNNDQECFLWFHLRHINPVKIRPG